jgi:hypothetical protein
MFDLNCRHSCVDQPVAPDHGLLAFEQVRDMVWQVRVGLHAVKMTNVQAARPVL